MVKFLIVSLKLWQASVNCQCLCTLWATDARYCSNTRAWISFWIVRTWISTWVFIDITISHRMLQWCLTLDWMHYIHVHTCRHSYKVLSVSFSIERYSPQRYDIRKQVTYWSCVPLNILDQCIFCTANMYPQVFKVVYIQPTWFWPLFGWYGTQSLQCQEKIICWLKSFSFCYQTTSRVATYNWVRLRSYWR